MPAARLQTATAAPQPDVTAPSKAFVDTYCATCHNQRMNTAGLAFDKLDVTNVAAHAEEWEKVVVKLRAGLMPPSGVRAARAVGRSTTSRHPSRRRSIAPLEADPNPGRTEPFHRLNRAEYQNAIRDLLALDIDGERPAADRRGELRLRQHRRRPEAVAAA